MLLLVILFPTKPLAQDNMFKNQNEVTQNSFFRYHDSEEATEFWPSMIKLNWVVNKHQMHTV